MERTLGLRIFAIDNIINAHFSIFSSFCPLTFFSGRQKSLLVVVQCTSNFYHHITY